MTTGKLVCLGSPSFARCASFRRASRMCLPTVAPETRRWESSQTISKSNPSSRGAL